MADHQQQGQEGGGTTGSMHYCFPRVTTCNSDTCQTGAGAGAECTIAQEPQMRDI